MRAVLAGTDHRQIDFGDGNFQVLENHYENHFAKNFENLDYSCVDYYFEILPVDYSVNYYCCLCRCKLGFDHNFAADRCNFDDRSFELWREAELPAPLVARRAEKM